MWLSAASVLLTNTGDNRKKSSPWLVGFSLSLYLTISIICYCCYDQIPLFFRCNGHTTKKKKIKVWNACEKNVRDWGTRKYPLPQWYGVIRRLGCQLTFSSQSSVRLKGLEPAFITWLSLTPSYHISVYKVNYIVKLCCLTKQIFLKTHLDSFCGPKVFITQQSHAALNWSDVKSNRKFKFLAKKIKTSWTYRFSDRRALKRGFQIENPSSPRGKTSWDVRSIAEF